MGCLYARLEARREVESRLLIIEAKLDRACRDKPELITFGCNFMNVNIHGCHLLSARDRLGRDREGKKKPTCQLAHAIRLERAPSTPTGEDVNLVSDLSIAIT